MFLNNHSYYSLKYGTLSVAEIIEHLERNNIEEFALTDINNTSASLSFVNEAQKKGIRAILGVDFRNAADQKYIVLAKNNDGFSEINEHLSEHFHRDKPFEERAPEFKNCFVIYPWREDAHIGLRENEFFGVYPWQLNRLTFKASSLNLEKFVALHRSSFRSQRDFNTHRLLRAIDNNTLLSTMPESEQGRIEDKYISEEELEKEFELFPELIENNRSIYKKCSVDFEFGKNIKPKNKKLFTESFESDLKLIRDLIEEGLKYRYGGINEVLSKRIESELEVIIQKNFLSYFLINWDICRYARSQNYFYVGRGSGANSLIAYLLRITDVDPIELDLYFERFINLYRENPPDFDLDFSWKDREDVTRYIFEKHGMEKVALLATYTTFQARSTLRELGKVFGLPKEDIDSLTKNAPSSYFSRFKPIEKKYDKGSKDHLIELVLKYSDHIDGFPNYLGIHAGGILISEEKISNYSAVSLPPKGWPTVHFDMIVAEDVGLYKFDILSQRGLGHIKDALEIVKQNQPNAEILDIHDIPQLKSDARIAEQIKSAHTLGCFYIESPAMRMLLTKLKVDNYLGLVAASSIIRPGVAKSGMMREYILRFRYPEKRKNINPIMYDIMPDTFGVMVYQEDVIKVAHYYAGLSLAEADVLRRGMSGKFRSKAEFQKVKDKFFENCDRIGRDRKLSEEIWFQIESFAGYSFSKGHSASYAVESYQSLYLKTYFPREFMVAVINNFGGFYRTEIYVHELRQTGVNIYTPCVNNSTMVTNIKSSSVYLGFIHVKNLEDKLCKQIIEERKQNGSFKSLGDFVYRISVSKEQLQILIQVGAFNYTGKTKKELYWEMHNLIPSVKSQKRENELFDYSTQENYDLPKLNFVEFEDAFDEIELLGFPLSSPFELLSVEGNHQVTAKQLHNYLNREVSIDAYLVTYKNTVAKGNNLMNFGTFLDVNGDFVDTVHFPNTARDYPFRGKGIYRITGKVVSEFDHLSIEVIKMERLPYIQDPRYR